MDLSVVLPTLDGRDRPATNLGALAEHTLDAEVVVANGPSADGMTGTVRERDDVDMLVKISDRDLNVARNAGLKVTGDDVVALLRYDLSVESSWLSALEAGIADDDVVTGSMRRTLRSGMTIESLEQNVIGGRTMTYFNGGDVALRHGVIGAFDGLDEYLQTGGARDAARRLARFDRSVAWALGMCVHREFEADGGVSERDQGWKYRSLTYRLVKNYGIRPGTIKRMMTHAVSDGVDVALDVLRSDVTPLGWVGPVCDMVGDIAMGVSDGLVAHARDRTRTRNPRGRSKCADRVVVRCDRR